MATTAAVRKSSPARKRELAEQICQALTVHASIEEEIFYPAARKAIKDNALMNEAAVEHDSAKALIAQIQALAPLAELSTAL